MATEISVILTEIFFVLLKLYECHRNCVCPQKLSKLLLLKKMLFLWQPYAMEWATVDNLYSNNPRGHYGGGRSAECRYYRTRGKKRCHSINLSVGTSFLHLFFVDDLLFMTRPSLVCTKNLRPRHEVHESDTCHIY